MNHRAKPAAEIHAERRRRLLDAARTLIEKHGASGLSVRALSVLTGTSPVTTYDVFGSKAGVLQALIQEDRSLFEAQIARVRTDDNVERMMKVITITCALYRKKEEFYRAVFQQYFSAGAGDLQTFLDAKRPSFFDPAVNALIAAGLLVELDARAVIDHLENVYLAAHRRWCFSEHSVDYLEAELGLGFAIALRGLARESVATFDARIRTYGKRLKRFLQD